MTIETCAKINLTLEMLRRRPDGYHDLATLFQAVDLCDRITLEPAEGIRVEVEGADIPTDERNLCYRAAALLADRFARRPTVRIVIEKRIPVGAGLGGGSGNAAGTLAGLARLWDLPVTDAELAVLGAELGSDVAFFVRGGAAVGTGRGERLAAVPMLTGYRVLILAPAESVSTGEVYRALRQFRPEAGEATRRLADGLRSGQIPPPSDWLINDLEAPAAGVSTAVRRDRDRMASITGWPWRLSGSGGAWFLLAPEAEATEAEQALKELWPGRRCWSVRPVDYGWRMAAA